MNQGDCKKISQAQQPASLDTIVTHTLEEARMVLPGIQALFGFQLIAVFNETFSHRLSYGEQVIHLGAIALVALSAALFMAPAAYHRIAEPYRLSKRLARTASALITAGMIPLLLGIACDFYLIARLILSSRGIALGLAATLTLVIVGLWFGFPLLSRWRRNHKSHFRGDR